MAGIDYAARYRVFWKLAEQAYRGYLRFQTEEAHERWMLAVATARQAYQDLLNRPIAAPTDIDKAKAVSQLDAARAILARAATRLRVLEGKIREKHKAEAPARAGVARGEQRVNRRQAVPTWLTRAQRAEMTETYRVARARGMHVDHIVPIMGKTVCGLHVPWNLQILTPVENMRKGNRLAA